MQAEVGIHLRTRDRVAVLDALRAAMGAEGLEWVGGGPDADPEAVRMLLLPPRGQWTSLYPEEGRMGDDLPGLLALQLKVDVLTLGRYEEAAFSYRYHGPSGDLVDQFHSCPDYAKDVDEDDAGADELERTRGRPERLAPLLASGGSVEALGELLKEVRIERLRDHSVTDASADIEGAMTRFAELLALPDPLDGFDVLWHLGLEEDDDNVDLRYLAYGVPEEPHKAVQLLSGFKARLRERLRRKPEAPSDEASAEEPDGEDDTVEEAKT